MNKPFKVGTKVQPRRAWAWQGIPIGSTLLNPRKRPVGTVLRSSECYTTVEYPDGTTQKWASGNLEKAP